MSPTTSVDADRRAPFRQAAILLGAIALVLIVISVIAMFGNTRPGARADILGPRRSEPGERVDYRVSVRDTEGVVQRVVLDFGDGARRVVTSTDERDCGGPAARDVEIPYTYEQQGVFTARAEVTTGGCGAPTETVHAVRTIRVRSLRQ